MGALWRGSGIEDGCVSVSSSGLVSYVWEGLGCLVCSGMHPLCWLTGQQLQPLDNQLLGKLGCMYHGSNGLLLQY